MQRKDVIAVILIILLIAVIGIVKKDNNCDVNLAPGGGSSCSTSYSGDYCGCTMFHPDRGFITWGPDIIAEKDCERYTGGRGKPSYEYVPGRDNVIAPEDLLL